MFCRSTATWQRTREFFREPWVSFKSSASSWDASSETGEARVRITRSNFTSRGKRARDTSMGTSRTWNLFSCLAITPWVSPRWLRHRADTLLLGWYCQRHVMFTLASVSQEFVRYSSETRFVLTKAVWRAFATLSITTVASQQRRYSYLDVFPTSYPACSGFVLELRESTRQTNHALRISWRGATDGPQVSPSEKNETRKMNKNRLESSTRRFGKRLSSALTQTRWEPRSHYYLLVEYSWFSRWPQPYSPPCLQTAFDSIYYSCLAIKKVIYYECLTVAAKFQFTAWPSSVQTNYSDHIATTSWRKFSW